MPEFSGFPILGESGRTPRGGITDEHSNEIQEPCREPCACALFYGVLHESC